MPCAIADGGGWWFIPPSLLPFILSGRIDSSVRKNRTMVQKKTFLLGFYNYSPLVCVNCGGRLTSVLGFCLGCKKKVVCTLCLLPSSNLSCGNCGWRLTKCSWFLLDLCFYSSSSVSLEHGESNDCLELTWFDYNFGVFPVSCIIADRGGWRFRFLSLSFSYPVGLILASEKIAHGCNEKNGF